MFIQERPTTEAIMSYALSATGIVYYAIPKVLRQLSISNTSGAITFVHIYNMTTTPTNLDVATFIFPINGSNNVTFNPFDHQFTSGIAMRATTSLTGTVSPVVNSLILNMTLSE